MEASLFRVKICGVTCPADARDAVQAGADAIGVNFYAPSPRSVTVDEAAAICEATTGNTSKVGVFVNMCADEIRRIADRCRLDVIQLHGDEPPSLVAELEGRTIVRAFRCRDQGLAPIAEYLKHCGDLGRLPDGALIDAYAPGSYGGTGRVVDWSAIPELRRLSGEMKIVLAGGLTPWNVADAIRAAQPDAVDTASGVESAPGVKDRELVRRFIESARQAFQLDAQ